MVVVLRKKFGEKSGKARIAPSPPMRHMAHSCVTCAPETSSFGAEIRRIAASRKFAGKSETVGIDENPLMLHM
jgi:hypothetical protein